jgi:hypothetical protein
MAPGSGPSFGWLEPATSKYGSQNVRDVYDVKSAAVVAAEYECIERHIDGAVVFEPAADLAGQVSMKGDPADPSLAGTDPKAVAMQVQVLAPNAKRLTDAQSRAVKQNDEQPMATAGTRGHADPRDLGDDPADLLRREDIRQEIRRGLRRPPAVRYKGPRVVAPTK